MNAKAAGRRFSNSCLAFRDRFGIEGHATRGTDVAAACNSDEVRRTNLYRASDAAINPIATKANPTGSISTAAEQHHKEGLADDPDVPAQRPILDILKVELDHVLVTQLTSAADLPGTAQSGYHLETA
jgi:hypothetical protein